MIQQLRIVMNKWRVYIIQCSNNSLYTGITTDIERRFNEHQNDDKKASKYCLRFRPLKLVYKSLPSKIKVTHLKRSIDKTIKS